MKLSPFCLYVALGLLSSSLLSAQQYHDALAFGLKGNVKEYKVVSVKNGSNSADPYGFCSLSFSKDGKLEAIKKETTSPSDCVRKISDIVRSNGLLTGLKYLYTDTIDGSLYDIRFRYKGGDLIGFYTLFSSSSLDANGDVYDYFEGYQVYSYSGIGEDSFEKDFFAVVGISFKDQFTAQIEDGFKQGGDFLTKLESVAEKLWEWDWYDLLYGEGTNRITTKYKINTRDSHGNYTLLTDEEDGESIKRIITYWDDEPAAATTTQATPKPSAAPTPKPAPKSVITEKTPGLRLATPKELSVQDLITRPFGVLSQNSRKLSRKQLLYDLSDYGWVDKDQKKLEINLRARDGYDMVILGIVPNWAFSEFEYNYDDHYYDTEKTALTRFGYQFTFDKGKDANIFIHQLVDLIRAEGINMTKVKKYHAYKGRFKNSEIYLSNSVDRKYVSLFINYQVLGNWIQ